MKKPSTHLLAVALMALAANSAHAQLIDEFDGEIAVTSAAFTFDDNAILGGERDFPGNSNASIAFTGGQLIYNSLTGIASAQLYYDGDENDSSLNFGLGGVNLTAGGADRFQFFVSSNSAVSVSVSISIYEDGSNYSRGGPITFSSTGLKEIAFADLTHITGAGANITNANAILFAISDNTSPGGPGTVTVDYLRTNGTDTTFEDGFED